MAVVVHRHHPAGVADVVPLVLLPAFPFDSRMWQEVVAALPGVPTLTVDLPGFGAAHEWAEPEGTTLGSYADALADALDGAEVRKAVVAGVSMGGYVLLALAERYPGLLAGVGLLDTKASADTSEATANRLAIARRALGEEGAGAVIGMLSNMLSPTTARQRPEVVQRVREWLEQAPPAAIAAAQRAMAQRPDRLAVLDGLDVPALVLYGADDAITGQDDHEAMGSTLGTEPVRVPEAGHLAAVEQPRQVASALTRLHEAALARLDDRVDG